MTLRIPTLCVTALMMTAALAAEPPRPGPAPLEQWVAPLRLTTAQQAKLRPLFAQARARAAKDVHEAAADGARSDANRLQQTLAMHAADFRLQLAEILTPQQLATYERMTADRTPREEAAEMHSAHGHRESDTPATAAEQD